MIRSAKCVLSRISEPPNPRLTTCCSGKSRARVFQRRMVEEPMNSTAPLGGGLVWSVLSKAAISCSHRVKLCSAATQTAWLKAKVTQKSGKRLEWRFMGWIGNRSQPVLQSTRGLSNQHFNTLFPQRFDQVHGRGTVGHD